MEEEGPSHELHLNRAKSPLYVPADSSPTPNPLPPEIPITRGGFSLLGYPVGPATFREGFALQRVEDCLSKLPDFEDSQIELILLRSCLALPKVSFSLKTCPLSHIEQATVAFDNTMRDALSELAGSPLSEWSWLKASLGVVSTSGGPPCTHQMPTSALRFSRVS